MLTISLESSEYLRHKRGKHLFFICFIHAWSWPFLLLLVELHLNDVLFGLPSFSPPETADHRSEHPSPQDQDQSLSHQSMALLQLHKATSILLRFWTDPDEWLGQNLPPPMSIHFHHTLFVGKGSPKIKKQADCYRKNFLSRDSVLEINVAWFNCTLYHLSTHIPRNWNCDSDRINRLSPWVLVKASPVVFRC